MAPLHPSPLRFDFPGPSNRRRTLFSHPLNLDGLVTFFGRDGTAEVTWGPEPSALGHRTRAAGRLAQGWCCCLRLKQDRTVLGQVRVSHGYLRLFLPGMNQKLIHTKV